MKCGEQARFRRTCVPYNGMKADYERSWKERLIMKISRLALFTVSVHWAEAVNALSVCSTIFDRFGQGWGIRSILK